MEEQKGITLAQAIANGWTYITRPNWRNTMFVQITMSPWNGPTIYGVDLYLMCPPLPPTKIRPWDLNQNGWIEYVPKND